MVYCGFVATIANQYCDYAVLKIHVVTDLCQFGLCVA